MINNINFKGYSNIISANRVYLSGLETSYIAMKLDDIGENDLSKYKQIRSLQGYPEGLKNEDILTFFHMTDGRNENLYFGNKAMCWGDQLLTIRDEYIPKFVSKGKYKNIEDLHLKIYTFLANITKRLANDKFENEDNDMKRVVETVYNNLKNLKIGNYLIYEPTEAFELTSVGCLKKSKFQPLARAFNKKIVETMTHFFR